MTDESPKTEPAKTNDAFEESLKQVGWQVFVAHELRTIAHDIPSPALTKSARHRLLKIADRVHETL